MKLSEFCRCGARCDSLGVHPHCQLVEERAIYAWMLRNAHRFADSCGEVDCTAMVEAWDFETEDGSVTRDSDHKAWDVAIEVATAWEKNDRRLKVKVKEEA